MKPTINIFWYRRDLRLKDNAALYYSLKQTAHVLPIFIFDRNILDELEDRTDKRLQFIHHAITDLQNELLQLNSSLKIFYDTPINVFTSLIEEYHIQNVYCNHDYELYALQRDSIIKNFLHQHNIQFHTYKDQVMFEKNEVVKDDNTPYTIFTPYSKKWKQKLQSFYYKEYPTEKYFNNFYKQPALHLISLAEMNFTEANMEFPKKSLNVELIKKYKEQRDFPSLNATSRLSVHLRFGTISIRKLVQYALPLNETFLNELIWRDFYFQILHHFPQINANKAFKPQYDLIEWRNNEQEYELWCNGKTGYPIVDAGMNELNETGFMHNRVRMIVASFLTKHLLIDWRWGETYFAKKLLDFDFAANNGGWQWAAGSGCDAAPYFRVFNPTLQTEKFDKDGKYIKKWIPNYHPATYIQPIVVHEVARKRCLEVYAKALNNYSK